MPGRHRDVRVAGHRGRGRRADKVREAVRRGRVAALRIGVRDPCGAVGEGDDRIELVVGHDLVDLVLDRRCHARAKFRADVVTAVGLDTQLEEEAVPRPLQLRMGLVEFEEFFGVWG